MMRKFKVDPAVREGSPAPVVQVGYPDRGVQVVKWVRDVQAVVEVGVGQGELRAQDAPAEPVDRAVPVTPAWKVSSRDLLIL
ncbi:MAG: hypothetical protein WD317_05350 [Balneolaceae bacterium]